MSFSFPFASSSYITVDALQQGEDHWVKSMTTEKMVLQVAGDSVLISQINYFCFHFGTRTISTGTRQVHTVYNMVYDQNNKAKFVTSKNVYIHGVCMNIV